MSKLNAARSLGSDRYTNMNCQPCYLGGKRETAKGYCQNCKENLCGPCIENHEKALAHHHVDGNTPKAVGVASDEMPKCSSHPNEEIKFYCKTHGKLGCAIGLPLDHASCEINYIPDVSENFVESQEYRTFERYIDNLKVTCAKNMTKLDSDILSIREACAGIIASVKARKKEIIDSLEMFEKELEETVAKFSKTNINEMFSLRNEYDALVSEIVRTESTLKMLQDNEKLNALFCEVKRAIKKVQEYQSQTYNLRSKVSFQECKFLKNTALNTVLTKKRMFGSIEINEIKFGPCNSREVVERQPLSKINIKADDDTCTCYATGLAFLSPDRLAVVDKANKNVKIVDVANDKIVSKLALSSCPRDITVIPPDKLAVTLRDEKLIQLLSTTPGLSKTDQIKTDEKCRGIEYCNNKLIVTFDSWKAQIQILNLNGKSLQTFDIDKTGNKLFTEPKCVALSPNIKDIYVTDFMKKNILRLTQCGTVTASFERSQFMGVVVSSGGTVFACAKHEDTILQLTDDLSRHEVALSENEGIKGPIGLAYSWERNLMYVSCGKGGEETCNKLHIFMLKQINK